MEELVNNLKRDGVLRTPAIIDAFLKNDRARFVWPEYSKQAYVDVPLPVKKGQTISQPYTVAFMLELLAPEKGQTILDVGFGSGWTTALLSSIVGAGGRVFAMEVLPEVYAFGERNLAKLKRKNIRLCLGSGRGGWPERGPFDRILVSAAAREVPEELKKQLKAGGKMVLPIGGEAVYNFASWQAQPFYQQDLKLIKKYSENEFDERDFPGFAFVPLIK